MFLGSMFSMLSIRFESEAQMNINQEKYAVWLSALNRDPSAAAEMALEFRKMKDEIISSKQWIGVLMVGVSIVCLALGIRMHSESHPKAEYHRLSKEEIDETERIAATRLAKEEIERQAKASEQSSDPDSSQT